MKFEAICAIATPMGSSALGIIRLSGKDLSPFFKKVFSKTLADRKATLVNIFDGDNLLDRSIVIYYKSPRSYTGEDLIEIICHGNQIIMNSIIDLLIKNGARNANPGEFSERAFLNNKVSLTQAEAIGDLILASDERAVKAAQNSLSGKFSKEIQIVAEKVLTQRAEVESIINFPEDEDVPDLNFHKIITNIDLILSLLEASIENSFEGAALNRRRKYVFAGKPNTGKSSLINCMLRKGASIVSNHAGTTRDAIEYELNINNRIVNITDTAGLRDTSDDIEQEGISKALECIDLADRVFYVVDDTKGLTNYDTKFISDSNINKYTIIFNKIDLTGKKPFINDLENHVYVSAKNDFGIDLVKQIIQNDFSNEGVSENAYMARSRHLELMRQTKDHLAQCKEDILVQNLDLAAEELRLAHVALSSILGQNSTEDLLKEIFNSFCIGK